MSVLRNFLMSCTIFCMSTSSFASYFQRSFIPFFNQSTKIHNISKILAKSGKSKRDLDIIIRKIETRDLQDKDWELIAHSAVSVLSKSHCNSVDEKAAYSILEKATSIDQKTIETALIYGKSELVKLVVEQHISPENNNFDGHNILLQLVLAMKIQTLELLLSEDSPYKDLFHNEAPDYFIYIIRRSQINEFSNGITTENFSRKHEQLTRSIAILSEFYHLSDYYRLEIESVLTHKLMYLRDKQKHFIDKDAFSSIQLIPLDRIVNHPGSLN